MHELAPNTSVVWHMLESDVLSGNPLGDPAVRRLPVLLPPGYTPARRYPVLYGLSGFAQRGAVMLNDMLWDQALPERLDRLYAAGMPHAIVVLPDCSTSLGGSQYINSAGTGRYEDYLTHEIIPFIDARYATIASAGGRGLFGKSSGGYGTLVLAMRHPELFGALACHSGDISFDLCFLADLPRAATVIGRAGGLAAWLQQFAARRTPDSFDFTTLSVVALSTCYSPDAASEAGIALPFDLNTCELRAEVWARWLAWDPIALLEQHADALRGLRLLYLDCGNRDEHHLHFGARRFVRRLQELSIAHQYEEFDAGHRNTHYRYDESLPRLAAALAGAQP